MPPVVERGTRAVKQVTPWTEAVEREVEHVPLHACFLVIYACSLLAYAVYVIVAWTQAPEVETFSSQEAADFGAEAINVTVQCPSCVLHSTKGKFWTVGQSYPSTFGHCASLGLKAVNDQNRTSVTLCRTTDNIADDSGVKVWIGNISATGVRATVVIYHDSGSGTPLEVTTPLEHWHEKTLLLGLKVNRDKDDCISSEQCKLEKDLYLASMQYDGKVSWGGDTWGGAQLNVRMLRFAQVYTKVPRQTFMEVLASIGGASGLLITALGFALQVSRFVYQKLVGGLAPKNTTI